MYIGYFTFDIANSTKINYNICMNINFENKVSYNQILFRYAKGKSLVDGYEIHPYNEILYYMGGGGKLLTENFEENLKEGTLIIIPKNTYHRMLIFQQNSYKRLAINFPDTELPASIPDTIKMLSPVSYNIRLVLQRMCKVMEDKSDENNIPLLLYGAFLMLLAEININSSRSIVPKPRPEDELISKCIRYIDDNFASELSVEGIAREMNVSSSSLFQCFKRQLGTPIYKYITEKRLIYAHHMIQSECLPTKVYLDCGYKDYATFYKAYVKMFGYSPSKKE